jgi:hypothetical protein
VTVTVGGLFSVIGGPFKMYVVARTRMPGHRLPPWVSVTVTAMATVTVTVTVTVTGTVTVTTTATGHQTIAECMPL